MAWLRLDISIKTDDVELAGYIDLPMGGPDYAEVVANILAADLSVASVTLGGG